MLMLAPVEMTAKSGKRPFFDSKSWTTNVAGDVEFLEFEGLGPHIYDVGLKGLTEQIPLVGDYEAIANSMNSANIGNKFIDCLTQNGRSEELLKNLALANMQRVDAETGSALMRAEAGQDVTEIVKEDYLPVLTHNYIILTNTLVSKKDTKEYYNNFAIYKVEVSNDEAFDIMANINNPEGYNKLKFKVEYVTCGKCRDFQKIVLKEVPDLMIRGVLTRRHPARISIGTNAGIKKGDLVSIFSQRVDKNGQPYSKRISRARVGKVWDDEAQINFEANTAGNRKNGDVVVRTPDSHSRLGIRATWAPHVWGGDILFDEKSGFTRSGIIHHFLMDLGFAMTDHPGDKFIVRDKDGEFKSPVFFNLGLGYGLSKTFLGFLDVMPYALVQPELAWMINKTAFEKDAGTSYSDLLGVSIRVPVGVRISVNVGYPVRFFVEGGYAFNFGLGDNYKLIDETMDYLKSKRKGIFLGAGFMF